ncbi:hypothetical protein [Kitasatospora sp. NPDC127116]|uniref:hypothetical protein n=1 Tax=Kitasatospora sp. NPDC127116 TaxID=3345367 RepID=UPI0036336D38
MTSKARQLFEVITRTGPSSRPEPLPRRGDQFEQWLKAQRDACIGHATTYNAIDGLLDQYRLHADTGTPLDQHTCENGTPDDCHGCYEAAGKEQQ